MSYKSENWKDKLAEVRAYGTFSERKEESIEQSADDILNNEIEEELKSFEEEVVVEEQLDEFNTKMPEKVRVQILDYMNKLMDLPYGSKKFKEMKKEMEKLQQKYSVKDEVEYEVEEEVVAEESMEDKIKKLFRIKDKKATLGIANLLNMTDVKVLQSMQKQNPKGFERMAKKMGELPSMEEVEVEESVEKESVEKTTEKLVEKNMLGRLAKQLKLNEQGKQQMFDYFEKGELKQ